MDDGMSTATLERSFLVLGLAARKIVLEPRESALRTRMALWVVLVSVLAPLTSLQRAQRIVAFGIRSRTSEDRSHTPAQLGRAIDSLLSIDLFVFRRSCWKRAMVLHRFLALEGIESRINFGLRKNPDGTVDGHAWLEHQARPFLEQEVGNYSVTFCLPRIPSATGVVPTGSKADPPER